MAKIIFDGNLGRDPELKYVGTAPSKFRKKPVTVEAMRFSGTPAEISDVYRWIEENTAGSFDPMHQIHGFKPWPESGVAIDPSDGTLIIVTRERAHWADEPLPEPEPDWLNAPAVMARVEGWVSCADPQVFTRYDYEAAPSEWLYNGSEKPFRWQDLRDVTPLYPLHASANVELKGRAFDRWLEQVKAEAWDEGHHAGQHNEHEHRPGRAMTNPYRQETQA